MLARFVQSANALVPIAVTVSGSFSETRVMFPLKHSLPISVTVYPSSLSGTIRFSAVPEYPVICAVLSDRTLYVKSPDLLSVERTETAGPSGGASSCFSASGASGSAGRRALLPARSVRPARRLHRLSASGTPPPAPAWAGCTAGSPPSRAARSDW